jgi:quinoprotein dehydrogenase-associated probable ABC transporter substrate-binding protein
VIRAAAALLVVALTGGATPLPLRVCADPNNLPFSNDRQEGFENALARLLATDLERPLAYVWWPQRRGFIRNTLNAGACDVVMGVPAGFDLALTTRAYYRSSYVFVSLRSRNLRLQSLDDPRLRSLRVGVQMIGDDFANSPPAHALSSRGIVSNVVGYSVLGDYSQANPPARIVEAVSKGDVDAAIVWGPLAGFFAARAPAPLALVPVSPERDGVLPFAFDISMAVRRSDDALKARLDAFLERRHAAIDAILRSYGVPRSDRRPERAS